MALSPLRSGASDAVAHGLLPEHTVDGAQTIDPAIDKAQNLAPLVGFFLSVTLTSLCFWRLAVFTILALKYRWQRPKWGWSRVVCFWWLLLFLAPDDDLAAAEEAASTAAPGEATGLLHIHHHYHHQPSSFSSSSSYRWTGAGGRRYGAYAPTSAETASLSVPPPPRALVRKILFHLALFLSVAVDLPAWSVLVYSSITDDTLFDGSETSNPVKWPKADPAPVLLYLLHLSTYFFLFLAMAIVLNMWLTVAEFDPRKHLRIWRGFAVVALITFIVLWAWVVVEAFQTAVTPHDVARTRAGVTLALYASASLLLLALLFLVAGCCIQHRIVSVFAHQPGESSLAWVNLLALVRLNAVTLTCLLCFLLRALDLALPSHRGRDFFRGYTICSSPNNAWGIVVCYGRWALHMLPILALLYIMRHPGESPASAAAAAAAHVAATGGGRPMRRRARHHHSQRRRPAAPLHPAGGGYVRHGADTGAHQQESKKTRGPSQRSVSFRLPNESPPPPPRPPQSSLEVEGGAFNV